MGWTAQRPLRTMVACFAWIGGIMRIGTLALAAALCLLTRAAWPANEVIPGFADLPIKTANGAPPSASEVRDSITYAGSVTVRRWHMTDAGPGKLIGRLEVPARRRTHIVVVEILYSPTSYSINYINSSHMNFNPSERTIHSSYGVWVGELVTTIDRNVGNLKPGSGSERAAGAPAALAASAAAASASAAPSGPVAEPTPGPPQVGDMWTYRATRVWGRGEIHSGPTVRTHVVRVASATENEVVDHLTIDGAAPISTAHTRGAYLVTQGYSIFSPYLGLWADVSQPISLGSATSRDPGCDSTHVCTASARIAGNETIKVAAGTFATTRIIVTQSWRSSGTSTGQAAHMSGGRTLTAWYSPALKRVVRYSSRVTVGDIPPVEPQFDVELVKYQLK
jgi:hypothetical protein